MPTANEHAATAATEVSGRSFTRSRTSPNRSSVAAFARCTVRFRSLYVSSSRSFTLAERSRALSAISATLSLKSRLMFSAVIEITSVLHNNYCRMSFNIVSASAFLRQVQNFQFDLRVLPVRLKLLIHELRIVGSVLRAQRLSQTK